MYSTMSKDMAKEIYIKIKNIQRYQRIIEFLERDLEDVRRKYREGSKPKGLSYEYRPPKESSDTESFHHRMINGIADSYMIEAQLKSATNDLYRANKYYSQLMVRCDEEDKAFIENICYGKKTYYRNEYEKAIKVITKYCTY